MKFYVSPLSNPSARRRTRRERDDGRAVAWVLGLLAAVIVSSVFVSYWQ